MTRRGNQAAFEALVGRYQSRLLAFCRHMLGSREDAEDVLQEVFAASFNAMLSDEREINVRPWLYRIARNRSLNHLRKTQAIGVDSMDVHLSENGQSTADKVHKREEFRALVADVQELPETQRTALLLREIDALSYEQIAEAMETTVPSIKSLLVRARVSLAEMSEARQLTCEEVREELGEVAEGLRRTTAPVRRHLRTCDRCGKFRKQLRSTNKALAAIMPVGPLFFLKKAILAHLGTTASAGGAAAASGGAVSAGAGAVASKAAAGIAAAAIVGVGAVEVKRVRVPEPHPPAAAAIQSAAPAPAPAQAEPQVVAAAAAPQRTTVDRTDEKAAAAARTKAEEKAAADKAAAKAGTTTAAAPVAATPPAEGYPQGPTQQGGDTTALPPQAPPAADPAPQPQPGEQQPGQPAEQPGEGDPQSPPAEDEPLPGPVVVKPGGGAAGEQYGPYGSSGP
jgi:RNA polymerase sigma factor (sigma-70 family)